MYTLVYLPTKERVSGFFDETIPQTYTIVGEVKKEQLSKVHF